MKRISSICGWPILLILISIQPSVFAADYSGNITEEYLRSQFTFKTGDKLKYSECETGSSPICTYIWGPVSDKDDYRTKAGLPPEGKKLLVIYAQAIRVENFQRVVATYSDAKIIDAVGVEAVWSDKRQQLSLITDKNLIIHVNIDVEGVNNPETKAVSIAKHVIERQ
jgi:hypothetical protein